MRGLEHRLVDPLRESGHAHVELPVAVVADDAVCVRVVGRIADARDEDALARLDERRPAAVAGPMVHSASYDFNDVNLTVGAAYWARLVETYLA